MGRNKSKKPQRADNDIASEVSDAKGKGMTVNTDRDFSPSLSTPTTSYESGSDNEQHRGAGTSASHSQTRATHRGGRGQKGRAGAGGQAEIVVDNETRQVQLLVEQAVLNLLSSSQPITPGGVNMKPRSGHNAVPLKDHVLVLGGAGAGASFNDIALFDTTNSVWKVPKGMGPRPPPRAYASSVMMDGRLFMFGGWTKDTFYNDLTMLASSDGGELSPDAAMLRWFEVIQSGPGPSPRAMHSLSPIGGRLYVFGGWNGVNFYNDMFVYSPVKHSWSKVSVSGVAPQPRAGHTATVIGTRIYIYGGQSDNAMYSDLWCFDTTKTKWKKITSAGHHSARSCHTATLVGSKIFFVGGWHGEDFVHDVDAYDVSQQEWSQVSVSGVLPSTLSAHSTSLIGKYAYVIGGWDGVGFMEKPVRVNTDIWNRLRNPAGMQPGMKEFLANNNPGLLKYISPRLVYLASSTGDKALLQHIQKTVRTTISTGVDQVSNDAREESSFNSCNMILMGLVVLVLLFNLVLLFSWRTQHDYGFSKTEFGQQTRLLLEDFYLGIFGVKVDRLPGAKSVFG
eukprot:GFYU01022803.1.p1 GENE.GFYU01022803.1~~GFYU01022803.1.p1  ORF type:complete len:564 (-),score=148.66 GFYU01022803.1:204-1895(-)